MLIDSTSDNEIYNNYKDEYSMYIQIFIAEEHVSKMKFRCPIFLGTFNELNFS